MISLASRTEYSFQQCFYHLKQLVEDSEGNGYCGVADLDNTFAHPKLKNFCKAKGIKPIYGVRLRFTDCIKKSRSPRQTYNYIVEAVLLAKNNKGLSEMYKLVNTAYDNFYYFPRLSFNDMSKVSDNIIILAEEAPLTISDKDRLIFESRVNYIIANDENLNGEVAIPTVNYSRGDQDAYETLCAFKGINTKTYSTEQRDNQFLLDSGYKIEQIKLADKIAAECNADIPVSEFVRYPEKKDIVKECMKGAIKLKVNINDEVYKERLQREISIIKERGFEDYFFIVSDVLSWAKKNTLVGPGRGSSGGSLVCYLLGITEIDPIKFSLIFERFVDLNRVGLPDIDTDIPDISRQDVIKYLQSKYGNENVSSIGTVTTFKPTSAIADTAKALDIPASSVQGLKDSIIERQGGDDRASMCIKDTFDDTEIGKKTLEQFPELRVAEKLEAHAKNAGKHAAGIIVSNEPLNNFAGVNSKEFTIMMSGKEVEKFGLLKIDILGLRTLTILEETAKICGFDFHKFYSLRLDDKNVFEIFNNDRVYGVFQFEGAATRNLTRQIKVNSFDDLCALTALSRPGALISGEAARYVKRKNGLESPVYYGSLYESITKPTYGAVVFQEQGMQLMKDYAGMSWTDVNTLRTAISKSYGIEFFLKYKDMFIEGAVKLGRDKTEAEKVWDTIASMGSYSFNKSHAVAYSIISYWTAWCKAYYPLEFAAANMNHIKDSDNAVKILRDFVINDNIEYVPVDPDTSDILWTIKDGKLLGGLTNLDGIGVSKARSIIKTRKTNGKYTPAIMKKLLNPVTPFDILFPAKHYFGDMYSNPKKYNVYGKVSEIKDLSAKGDYYVIGLVKLKDLVFRNTPQLILKRGHKVDKDLYYLKLIIEDDTSDIMCQIPPFKFEELKGKYYAETLIEDKNWVLVHGKIQSDYRSLSIEEITIIK